MKRAHVLEWLRLPTVHADAAALRAVGAGLTPVPGRIPPISMRQEIVEVSLFSATAVVEATFELQSHGATADVEVGFPRFARAGNNGFKAADASLQDFAVHADGERVVVTSPSSGAVRSRRS